MATELAKAYVQIVPSAEGIKGSISGLLGGEASSAGTLAGASFGGNLVGKLKGIIAAAGIGKALSSTLNEGAALQQSLGGVETLFKDSSGTIEKYASEAFKTAGLSANDYMETATGFAASLVSSLGGDTAKAAETANTAITDMADNSNKMGTSMESIQYAYQGFAKQNYTMLDNLKLGYGGTKTEMERLLTDATKISGVKYDMSNLNDVYSAIHVIQGQLGITGTTAKEAASTFTGSLASMKSAAQNLLGQLALGQDIGPSLQALGETVKTFVLDNLFPMVGNIIMQLPTLLSGTLSMAIQGLNMVSANADKIVQDGIDLISQLIVGIVSALPYLGEAAVNIVMALGNALINTDWISVANNVISQLQANLDLASGEILGTDGNIIQSVINSITSNLPGVLSKGTEIILNLVNGILQNLPTLITVAGQVINELLNGFLANLPTILQAGITLISGLAQGLSSNLPAIITAITQVIAQLIATIVTHLPEILQEGVTLILQLAAGLISAIPQLVMATPRIIMAICDAFGNYDWKSIGGNIIDGIIQGLKDGCAAIADAAKSVAKAALDAAKDCLGIHSPSRVMRLEVGRQITAGMALGITDNTDTISSAMKTVTDATAGTLQSNIQMGLNMSNNSVNGSNMSTASDNGNGGYTQNVYITSPTALTPSEVARQTRNATRNMVLAMQGV